MIVDRRDGAARRICLLGGVGKTEAREHRIQTIAVRRMGSGAGMERPRSVVRPWPRSDASRAETIHLLPVFEGPSCEPINEVWFK